MMSSNAPVHETPSVAQPKRHVWQAIKRGFAERCPHCGEGRMFHSYLKVNPSCSVCGEELHHHRADDAPPYITIFVVGHIIGTLMLLTEEINDALPIWIHAIVWTSLTIILTLSLLPRFKGALIAYQWALRMHGFDPNNGDDE
jgi:uncharacterized protein (DUF983 family)